MSSPQKDRSHWVVKKCESFEEMRAYRVQQWQDRPFIERLDAAWELMVDAWKLKKYDLNELRFQRSVTIVKRRRS